MVERADESFFADDLLENLNAFKKLASVEAGNPFALCSSFAGLGDASSSERTEGRVSETECVSFYFAINVIKRSGSHTL